MRLVGKYEQRSARLHRLGHLAAVGLVMALQPAPPSALIPEINETDDGQLYLVMAHYEGETFKGRDSTGPRPRCRLLSYRRCPHAHIRERAPSPKGYNSTRDIQASR